MRFNQRDRGRLRVSVLWGATAALLACSESPRTEGAFASGGGATDGTQGPATDAASTASSGEGSEAGAASEASDGGLLLDVGSADDSGPTSSGCQKIDFLFVIDNSASMGSYQQQLIASFGPFMETVSGNVQADDYHVMVIDSDAGDDVENCDSCVPQSLFCGDWCEAKSQLDLECESTLGAGEVAPYNMEASNTICDVPDGQRFVSSSAGEGQLSQVFSCMAKVGVLGSGLEQPLTAAVAALTTERDRCNVGFLRDDAVLVVTFISDDYPVRGTNDDALVGDPNAWFDALVGVKGGDETALVVLGITNLESSTCIPDGAAGGPVVHPTDRFVEFVDLFGDKGILGDVCTTPDYGTFFADAVGLIDLTCDEFEPAG